MPYLQFNSVSIYRKQNMQRTVLELAGEWKIEKVEPTYPLGALSNARNKFTWLMHQPLYHKSSPNIDSSHFVVVVIIGID